MKLQAIMDQQRRRAAKLSHTPRKPIKRQPLEDGDLWLLRQALAGAVENSDPVMAEEMRAKIAARRAQLKAAM